MKIPAGNGLSVQKDQQTTRVYCSRLKKAFLQSTFVEERMNAELYVVCVSGQYCSAERKRDNALVLVGSIH